MQILFASECIASFGTIRIAEGPLFTMMQHYDARMCMLVTKLSLEQFIFPKRST